jgi:hypothetical protein
LTNFDVVYPAQVEFRNRVRCRHVELDDTTVTVTARPETGETGGGGGGVGVPSVREA